jgi:uncharacterized membrane protein
MLFLLTAELCSAAWVCLSIHPLKSLTSFQFLPIMNTAAIRICVQVSEREQVLISLQEMLSGIAESHSTFNSESSCQAVFHSSWAIFTIHQNYLCIPGAPYLSALGVVSVCYLSHLNGWASRIPSRF